MKVLQPGKCRETLTYWAQLTSWITSVMQRQRLDEMFSHFCMTQKARIQFECVMERDSSFDCEKTEREKKKPGRNTSQALLCLSLSLGVLMRFVVASVCCAAPGSIGVCCLTVCGGRLWWWDRTDCVSNAHTYCHTQIQECPHTHTHIQHKQRNQFKDAHKNKLTNCVYIYIALSLSLSLQSLSLLHRCFCFKVWGLLSHFLSRGSFDHRCLRIFHGIGTHGLNLGPCNDDHRHNNHL